MYKDKDKQREANRKAQAKFKAKGITEQGITNVCWCCGVVIPKGTACCGPCAWSGRAKTSLNRPQPKAVKTFEDLPSDVQRDIDMMSKYADNPAEDKAARTARAISYQHLFPDRY